MRLSAAASLGLLGGPGSAFPIDAAGSDSSGRNPPASEALTLFLCGDVMTGRGIDQALPHPSDPRIHEPYVQSARGYVELAQRASGRIPSPVAFSYVWGDALAELERADLRIVNLETSVTRSDQWAAKGINYRMHPDNVACLTAAGIDCCVLANNHVLDWGPAGLLETLEVLRGAGMATAGAGRDLAAARAPATLQVSGSTGRLLVFAFAATDSGVPRDWAATDRGPGVHLLADLSERTASDVAAVIRAVRREADAAVASIHWGGNWGYPVPRAQRAFARALVDSGAVDVVHGHSSHHPKGIEIYRGRPILYGCGDFLNDYEGISGYEEYRSHLVLAYLVTLEAETRRLLRLEMTPLEIRRFRLQRASIDDARWMRSVLDRESKKLGTRVVMNGEGALAARWR